jgi:hypothetical protein
MAVIGTGTAGFAPMAGIPVTIAVIVGTARIWRYSNCAAVDPDISTMAFGTYPASKGAD